MEDEPLKAPKRLTQEDHRDLSESDSSTVWVLFGLALILVGGIIYSKVFYKGEGANEGQSLSALLAGGGSGPAGLMREAGLEKAEALPSENLAGTVTIVTDSNACRSLRNARDRVQQGMKKAHSSWEASEFKKDLASIHSRGTELGCWSGGPQ